MLGLWRYFMKIYFGSCLCKTVSFELEGEFNVFYLCHCSRCRKVTGSAHGANLFSKSAFKWTSGEDQVRTFRLPETRFARSFCQHCGSAVPTVGRSGGVVVPAGSLDCDVALRPNGHIFVGSKADWDLDLHLLPSFEELPTP